MREEWGVLWDLDGVLVDTSELHYKTWAQTLSEFDIPFSREQFALIFGMNNADILTFLLGEEPTHEDLATIAERKEEAFRQAVPGRVKLLSGVLEWLERLKSWDVRQAIASSAPNANIDILIDELNIRHYFAAFVSGFDLPGKPDPAIFLKAARRIGIRPKRCIVIEDSAVGVEAAKLGGMKCIAVTTTNPVDKLSKADIVVSGLDVLDRDTLCHILMNR